MVIAMPQPGHVFCPPDCSWEGLRCPPDCSGYQEQCPRRVCSKKGGKCIEPIASAVNRTLSFIWTKMLPLPRVQLTTPRLLLLTITFPHALQLHKLRHCAKVLGEVPNILWLVGEDAVEPSREVTQLLQSTGKPFRHIAVGPTRQGGNAQRDALLQIVRRERLAGILYNMDDDNGYHPSLWSELRVRLARLGDCGCSAQLLLGGLCLPAQPFAFTVRSPPCPVRSACGRCASGCLRFTVGPTPHARATGSSLY